MTIDPKSTAVVLIEYQNDFTSDGGCCTGAVSEVMAKTGMLAHTRDVVAAARSAGTAVVHAPITFAEGYGEITKHPYGILKGVVDATPSSRGRGRGDRRRSGTGRGRRRHRGQAWSGHLASTNLDFTLRTKGITTIALGASSPTVVSSPRCAVATRTVIRSSH